MIQPFELTNPEYRYAVSDRIGGTGERFPVAILSATVTCKKCEASWRAAVGNGPDQINELAGAFRIKCRNCGQSSAIPHPPFN